VTGCCSPCRVGRGCPLYARVNIIFGEKDKTDDGIAHIEGIDRDVVEATTGNRGLTTVVDRSGGVIVAISYWDEPLHSSEAPLTKARQAAAAAAGGDLVVERYELAFDDRPSTPPAGAVVRMARVQIEPAAIADVVAFLRTDLLPQLRTISGFHGVEMLIDDSTGSGVLMTIWNDEQGAIRSDTAITALQDEAGHRFGAKFPRTETYTMVRAAQLDA
jgi:hypothetical protein